jgi:predicted DNA-binding protein (MmcQ/YjbR family)
MSAVQDVARGLPEVTEEQPFRPGVPVFKVAGKVFAIYQPDEEQVTLKCDPELAEELRGRYAAVVPGYHVNKRLWNTVRLDGTVPDDELAGLVRHAYEQTVAKLARTDRDRLLARLGD